MDYFATNTANIARLRDNRDRAGLTQLADVLTTVPDGGALVQEARDAIAWIDATTPDMVTPDDGARIRVGDILTYVHAGHLLQGVVLTIQDGVATTNLGHQVAIR
ncbi:hypothetical protein [Microbacterium resistens]|uniref:hypothetical protein n=1 Tax=Microbacterium resistens TaxID=156977 RepID=UPI00366F97FF